MEHSDFAQVNRIVDVGRGHYENEVVQVSCLVGGSEDRWAVRSRCDVVNKYEKVGPHFVFIATSALMLISTMLKEVVNLG